SEILLFTSGTRRRARAGPPTTLCSSRVALQRDWPRAPSTMKTCTSLTATTASGVLLAGSPSQHRDVGFGRVDRRIALRDYPQVRWRRLPMLVRLATVPEK